jgi:transposase
MSARPHYTSAQRAAALQLFADNAFRGVSLRETARELGIRSPSTLRRWAMQTDDAPSPGDARGRRNQMPDVHRELLAGACLWVCHAGAPLHYSTIQSLCMDMFGRRVDSSWVRRFCQEFGLSRNRVRPRAPSAFGEDHVDQCVAFLQRLRDDSVEPSHLYAMDEKGLWDNAHPDYALGPRGR